MSGKYRGIDAPKRVNVCKRTFVVDMQGRLWLADVDATNRVYGFLTVPLVSSILWRCGERLEKVFGDHSCNGVFATELAKWSIAFEKASRLKSARGFVPIAKRWVVERSIAYTNYFQRVVKDYEYTLSSSVSWLYLANI